VKGRVRRLNRHETAATLERIRNAIFSTKIGDPRGLAELESAMADHARATGVQHSAIRRRADRAAKAKDLARRAVPLFELMTEVASTEVLLGGSSIEGDVADFAKLNRHVERLWDDASLLFRKRRYSRATGVAISCIEEAGKLAVARIQVYSRELERRGVMRKPATAAPRARRRRPRLYSHQDKHMLAAVGGALINSRLDRILGMDRVVAFLDDVERHKIEPFRQSCYYADRNADGMLLPDRIVRKDATFYVVLAGELLVEVQANIHEFDRLLRKVQRFERSIRHRWK
jgi:AbiV family abortive infection protein